MHEMQERSLVKACRPPRSPRRPTERALLYPTWPQPASLRAQASISGALVPAQTQKASDVTPGEGRGPHVCSLHTRLPTLAAVRSANVFSCRRIPDDLPPGVSKPGIPLALLCQRETSCVYTRSFESSVSSSSGPSQSFVWEQHDLPSVSVLTGPPGGGGGCSLSLSAGTGPRPPETPRQPLINGSLSQHVSPCGHFRFPSGHTEDRKGR